MTKQVVAEKNSLQLQRLYRWNIWFAIIYAFQGGFLWLVSTTHLFPVQLSYVTADPVASELAGKPIVGHAAQHLFDINMACLIAAFFFIAAIAHLAAATVFRTRYEADLAKGRNTIRWINYALSGGAMLVAMGLAVGVADLGSLKMIFAFGVIASALALVMEVINQNKKKVNWFPYGISCLAGVVPWGIYGLYLWGAAGYGDGGVPGFVCWMTGTVFALFVAMAAVMYLHYKQVGAWKDYLYTERMYMVISLGAKTALAWQLFAGLLRP